MGPTRGAREDERSWRPRRTVAILIRAFALLFPLTVAFVAIRLVGPVLFRPAGFGGTLLWILQAAAIGAVVSRSVDLVTRRLLPLAVLFNLSLVFPDRAPSRFGVALRAGTIRRLRERADELAAGGRLGPDENDAARQAIEMVLALGRHDRLTRGHTERVRAYADLIGAEIGLDREQRNRLAWGVILHDVGKMTVPPEILNKPGRPTEEEWAILSGHPAAGVRMLEPLSDWLGEWKGAVGEHHERWDGTGYPNRLAGEQISLAGRIAAVADAFDVITSKRSYKSPMSNESARRELVRCAGTQFDPQVVRAFMNVSLGRRRPAGSAAWLGDTTLWGTASTASTGLTAAASVGVALGAGAVTAAAPPAGGHRAQPVVEVAEPDVDEPAADPADDASGSLRVEPERSVVVERPEPDGSAPADDPDDVDEVGGDDGRADVPPSTTAAPRRDDPPVRAPVPATVPPTVPPTGGIPSTTLPPGPRPRDVVDPIVDDVVDPIVDDVVDPIVDDVVAPIVDDVVAPVVDDVVAPIVDDVVEPVVESVVDDVVDPITPPTVDTVVDTVVDDVLGGALAPVGGRSGGRSLLP